MIFALPALSPCINPITLEIAMKKLAVILISILMNLAIASYSHSTTTFEIYDGMEAYYDQIYFWNNPFTVSNSSMSVDYLTTPGSDVSFVNAMPQWGWYGFYLNPVHMVATPEPGGVSTASMIIHFKNTFTFSQNPQNPDRSSFIPFDVQPELSYRFITDNSSAIGTFSYSSVVSLSTGGQLIQLYAKSGDSNVPPEIPFNELNFGYSVLFDNLESGVPYDFSYDLILNMSVSDPIPEPSTIILYGIGILVLATISYRKISLPSYHP
jgi:hypothetical protein